MTCRHTTAQRELNVIIRINTGEEDEVTKKRCILPKHTAAHKLQQTQKLLSRYHRHPTQNVIDFNNVFSALVVTQILIEYLLHTSNDSLWYVQAMKKYHFLKQL